MSESLRAELRALPDFPPDMPDFDAAAAPADPVELFLDWLHSAIDAGIRQPHAFSLATATAAGVVSSRMLILKGIEDGGWQFASSQHSRKGRELTENPQAAMNFSWLDLGRQVRLVGRVTALSDEESESDWLARPGSDGTINRDWRLYALRPVEIEFWQGRHDRHHVRHTYRPGA